MEILEEGSCEDIEESQDLNSAKEVHYLVVLMLIITAYINIRTIIYFYWFHMDLTNDDNRYRSIHTICSANIIKYYLKCCKIFR